MALVVFDGCLWKKVLAELRTKYTENLLLSIMDRQHAYNRRRKKNIVDKKMLSKIC